MTLGLALSVAALALRATTPNRHVRGRLLVSSLAFVLYAGVAAAIRYGLFSPDLARAIAAAQPLVQPLVLAFGAIVALVALTVNPWREDRLPERFPTIVQDSIVILLFALAATPGPQAPIFAATAVSAVVIGFALQDTLGNLFAGLAIQIEKPFRVGHWVRIAEVDGLVSEITWRAP